MYIYNVNRVYVRWRTGLLVSSDWLRPVTRGGWRGGFPDRGRGSADVSCGLYKGWLTVWWSFSSGLLTGWCVCAWTWWQWFDFCDCDSAADSDTSTYYTALTWRSTVLVIMTGLGQGWAIAAYHEQANSM